MIFRIIASFILLISILYLPFWVSVILGLFIMAYFSYYFEGVIIFLISDLLYGIKEVKFANIYVISFLISIIVLFIIEMLKKKLRVSL